jgi:beta-glucosidase
VQAVLVYGSPYVLTWLERNLPETIPYLFSYGQMSESSAILIGELFESSQFPHLEDKSFL